MIKFGFYSMCKKAHKLLYNEFAFLKGVEKYFHNF
ncbi:hypothetical protein ANAEL_02413 [Anaerolineales bacterium]|nr:hypothetical protein ANAEL_02413 [Anaerolineales bacterium]